MTELTDWYGKLSGQRTDACALQMQAVLNAESEDRGGSRPCHVAADDGQTYWIKQVNNPQSARVPVTEQVIAACGLLIGAPVRETRLIGIPADFEGEKLMNGTVLRQGIAHGSLNLEFAIFDKTWAPDHRDRDDNRRRHAACFALFDWWRFWAGFWTAVEVRLRVEFGSWPHVWPDDQECTDAKVLLFSH